MSTQKGEVDTPEVGVSILSVKYAADFGKKW
jgi:hypothetical protein